jgi:hypothetical protein
MQRRCKRLQVLSHIWSILITSDWKRSRLLLGSSWLQNNQNWSIKPVLTKLTFPVSAPNAGTVVFVKILSASSSFFYLVGLGCLALKRWTIGLCGRGISPSQGRCLQMTTQTQKKRRQDIDGSNGIRAHHPSVWMGQDISCLSPLGH